MLMEIMVITLDIFITTVTDLISRKPSKLESTVHASSTTVRLVSPVLPGGVVFALRLHRAALASLPDPCVIVDSFALAQLRTRGV